MATRRLGPLSDDKDYFQTGHARGGTVILPTVGGSNGNSLSSSNGFNASGTSDVFDLQGFDSATLFISAPAFGSGATAADIYAQISFSETGPFFYLNRRSNSGGVMEVVRDFDRMSNVATELHYKEIASRYIRWRGVANAGAVRTRLAIRVQPWSTAGAGR